MKKLLKVLLMALCIMSLCACAKKEEPVLEKNVEEVQEEAEWQKQLGQKDKISVGVSPDYPPFESKDTNNNLIGFDPELFENVIKILNEINGTNYEVEWVEMEFDTIISAIQTGQVDFGCSGFTYDPDREGQVLFSEKYLESSIVAVTKNDSGIKSLEDLKGKKIAAQTGTTCADEAANYSNDVELIKDVNVMMEAFKADAYDAVFLDEPVAKNYASDTIVVLDEKIQDNDTYVICAAENNLLDDKISEAIKVYMQTDEYNALVEKWEVK